MIVEEKNILINFSKTPLQNIINFPYILRGYFSSTSNLYVKSKYKGVDVYDLIVNKFN